MMRKYPNQFSPHLHAFWGQVEKLPYDAHWFPALTAPRPFISLEGTDDPNVVHEAVRQTLLAARPAYALLDAPTDRIGIAWAKRPHGFVQADWDALLAFADHHLLGKPATRPFAEFPTAPVSSSPSP